MLLNENTMVTKSNSKSMSNGGEVASTKRHDTRHNTKSGHKNRADLGPVFLKAELSRPPSTNTNVRRPNILETGKNWRLPNACAPLATRKKSKIACERRRERPMRFHNFLFPVKCWCSCSPKPVLLGNCSGHALNGSYIGRAGGKKKLSWVCRGACRFHNFLFPAWL